MKDQEKVIILINTIEQLFDYIDIDDIIMSNNYDSSLEEFSSKLDEIFKDGLNEELLEMISKIDKIEIFYIEQVEKYKTNKIRRQIVEYLDNEPLYFDYDLIRKYIKENYKLASYIKNKDKQIELLDLNENVLLLMDAKYLTKDLILKKMKKSDFVSEIFLGLHGDDNDIYRFSMFYKDCLEINNLLYEQVEKYLKQDIYRYINASDLVKNNIDIAKLVVSINPKFVYYIGESIRDNFIN